MLRKSVSYSPTHEKTFLPLIVYTNIYVGTWYLPKLQRHCIMSLYVPTRV